MESSKEVDWSKAPEGATHYNAERICPWLKETPASYFAEDKGVWFNYSSSESAMDDIRNAVKRPQEWDGSGLPTIGTGCAYYSTDRQEWGDCEIVAHHNGKVVAVDTGDGSAFILPAASFLKIKTPEQIAAEERQHAIDEMNDLILGWGVEKRMLSVLYDAGYRKTEVKK